MGEEIQVSITRPERRLMTLAARLKKLMTISVFVGGVLAGQVIEAPHAAMAAPSPMQLLLSQSAAFPYLGHWCGGITEKAFVTGFDSSSGFPAGDVYLSTTCNGSGRGGHSTTYTAWVSAIWDFTGALVSSAKLPAAPTTNPTFTAFDVHGNEVYNSSNHAYLLLAPGFIPAPRVLGISATRGPASGGTAVTITGTGLTGATSVTFGAVAATFTVISDTEISTSTPASPAGTVQVTVTTPGGSNAADPSLQFTFVAAPIIDGISPNSGPVSGGTTVTIKGANFTDVTKVTFDGSWASWSLVDDSTITAISPPGEGPDDESLVVSSEGGTSTATYTYTGASVSPPSITRVTPTAGRARGGTRVTITGSSLNGVTKVYFGTTAAKRFAIISPNSITAVSPAGHGTVDLRAIDSAGRSLKTRADRFRFKSKRR